MAVIHFPKVMKEFDSSQKKSLFLLKFICHYKVISARVRKATIVRTNLDENLNKFEKGVVIS
jgi:hypothetical protein